MWKAHVPLRYVAEQKKFADLLRKMMGEQKLVPMVRVTGID